MKKGPADRSISIAVMAGGASRRMGRDKATIELNGISLLRRVVIQALHTGIPVMVVGRTFKELADLPQVNCIPDKSPGLGPLGGLVTCFDAVDTDVLAVACDMPMLQTDSYRWLLQYYHRNVFTDGIITVNSCHPEPLFSIYSRRLIPVLREHLQRDQLGLKDLIRAGDFQQVEAPAWVAEQLVNLNTPKDLESLMSSDFGSNGIRPE